MRTHDAARLIRRVPAFSDLGDGEIDALAELAVPRRFSPGRVVFSEGEDSNTCYVISSGQARAVRTHPDGRTITLATFGPGEFFGELAMLDDKRRSATVEAVGEMEAIAILGPDMQHLLQRHPEVAVRLVAAITHRLRAANERLARQSFQTVQSRVAQVVSSLAGEASANGRGAGRKIVITQAEIAQLAGSSRESASRFLAVLERAGIISQGRGKITVHDADALQRYVF